MLSTRFVLVVLLLSIPIQDPLCFSAQSGKSLIPDPGVYAGYLSVPLMNLAESKANNSVTNSSQFVFPSVHSSVMHAYL